MDNILEAKEIRKSYLNKKALRGVNLNIPLGKIVGLLGPNGSGKTTFLKIAAGILHQSKGEILIDGHIPGVHTKSVVSYLPDNEYLLKWMKVKDAVKYFKDFYSDFDEIKAEELLVFMNLDKNDTVKSLSKGMKEKLKLSLVLSRKAKLYILDEPLGGVDPTAREKILNAIVNNFSKDSSMIITTHLVNDIERIFDDVAFISEGEIVLEGNAEELRTSRKKSIDELYREVFQ
ncbi:ABC transporter ATP-binding protein [Clostridium estertheticum]|uniref:Multidrug ABC transporter ATP-binding protein n=1 Tax=Clostridium estertheticum subsp. estertheticum TaxID=1552 RepID=A0A1J0GPA6_9CLOT|nr:ABC transporter ATP-binding protein [Clostridium estertheticum]APC42736.1 multidrug ABC transporter ATP-binding protein [Clostridium estertheticum subsp. estertheticum]MBU3072781.1 ABC transporter ATP-binding protein [Clostridium estertheticum]MBU3163182.1 ABC transporter ATP-binding protein [Clostridium estertheticum]MBU3183888.1 ABC transporter ATP-binding protein [Clostridium estertheticum]MBZ9616585.1 ABC transporter ATP-binding protein [Clostridium estertheticum subsp. laramiense]